ncbi:MAG: hypothetical protein KY457_01020 [Actinobacteria bacterium]|nr:hypothetical protein [Actinomycetota bacterium]
MPTLDTRPDGALVIEADTAAEALAEVGARLGSDAEIVSAEKVHRGGWKGFFAREQVQLVARPRVSPVAATSGSTPREEPTEEPAEDPHAAGLDAVLARLMQQEDHQESAFQEVLVRELALAGAGPATMSAPAAGAPPVDTPPPAQVPPVETPPAAASAVETPVVAPPAAGTAPPPAVGPTTVTSAAPAAPQDPGGADDVAARVPTGVAWSLDRLRGLGLPDVVVGACEDLDPADDAAWVMALAGAVSSWCRPLPTRDFVLVGPRAHRLASGLGLDVARPGELVAEDRSAGLRVTDGPTGRRFVADVRARRWLHLVVGGARWEGFLLDDVTAVSWVGDESLPSALTAAGRLGLILGYGSGAATGNRAVRATPVDVALTIRSLLPRHA